MSSTGSDRPYHERIAHVRSHLGISQEKMAERVNLSLRGYQNYERGERDVPIALVRALYEVLSIDPVWLLTGDGSMIADKDIRNRLDQRVLDRAVAAIERLETRSGHPFKTRQKSRLIGLLYEQSQLLAEAAGGVLDENTLRTLLR